MTSSSLRAAAGLAALLTVVITPLTGTNAALATDVDPAAPAQEPFVAAPAARAQTVTRVAGDDRFSTAAAVSAASFPGTADDVFIVTGMNWPDALSAGPAAASVDAPVLPVQTAALPPAVAVEIQRLQPRRAWVVGGAGVVGERVLDELRDRGIDVTRISGASRYETAAAVAARFFPDAAGAYYASGTGYADALGGGAAAAERGWPLLLTARDSVPAATPVLGGERIVLGGAAAISEVVRSRLGARRVAGADRYATAAATALDAFDTATVGYLATGLNFPDALAGAAAAARDDAPLLLSGRTCVTPATRDAFTALGITSRVVLGGTAVVSGRAADLELCSVAVPPQTTEQVAVAFVTASFTGGDVERYAADADVAADARERLNDDVPGGYRGRYGFRISPSYLDPASQGDPAGGCQLVGDITLMCPVEVQRLDLAEPDSGALVAVYFQSTGPSARAVGFEWIAD